MKTKTIFVNSCLVALAFGASAFADDVIVTTRLSVTEAVSQGLVGGNLTAEVMNITGATIRNVNLRPEGMGDFAVAQEVLQLGPIKNGEIGTTNHAFHAQQKFIDAGEPIRWRLDFDDSYGNHKQLLIASEQRQ